MNFCSTGQWNNYATLPASMVCTCTYVEEIITLAKKESIVDVLLGVLSQVAVLFSLLLIGFLVRRMGVLDEQHVRGFTTIIVKVTLPAMILESMATMAFSPGVLSQSLWILLCSFVMYGLLLMVSIPLGRLLAGDPLDSGVFRFILIFSNVGFMGFPIIEGLYGTSALFYTAIFNLPFNLLTFTIGLILLVKKPGRQRLQIPMYQLLSPVVVSVILGFMLFLLSIPLPKPVLATLKLTGSITTPLSMIAVGAMLASSSLRGTLLQWRLHVLSFFRLILWPVLVFLVLRNFSDNPLLVAVPTIICGMPAAANTAILAQEYGGNASLASRGIFISTLWSILTIPLIALIIALVGLP